MLNMFMKKRNNRNVYIANICMFQDQFCNIILQVFMKAHLKTHISRVQEQTRSFKCIFCFSTFSQKGHMQTNVASVHEQKKPFKCEICPSKSFSMKHHLNKHISNIHEKNNPRSQSAKIRQNLSVA